MTQKEFLEEYKVFFTNCIDNQTGLLNSFERFRKLIELIDKKYFAFNRRKFYSRLISCTKENKEGRINDVDFSSLHFNNPNDMDYWDNDYIVDNLKLEQLITAFDKRTLLEFEIIQIDKEREEINKELQKLAAKLEPKRYSLGSNLTKTQINSVFKFLVPRHLNENTKIKEIELVFSDNIKPFINPIEIDCDTRLFVLFLKGLYDEQLINNKNWASVIEQTKMFKTKEGQVLLTASNISSIKSYINNEDNPLPTGFEEIESFINKLRFL